MCVWCVVRTDKRPNARQLRQKSQVRMKYRVQDYKKSRGGGGIFFPPLQPGPGPHPASHTVGMGCVSGGLSGPGRDVNRLPPSSADVKERVELYLYSPSEFSWSVAGGTSPFY